MSRAPITIRCVPQGAEYTRECATSVGFKRARTEESGLVIDLGDREVFLGWSQIEQLRQGLRSKSAQRRVAVQEGGEE